MRSGEVMQEVRDILDRASYYGTVPIRRRVLGRDPLGRQVVMVGSPGTTASVGMWIRILDERLRRGLALFIPAVRYRADEGIGNRYYYAAEVDERTKRVIYIVGGCTDFSGEGSRGKQIVEEYLRHLGIPFEDRPASYLIDLLLELK